MLLRESDGSVILFNVAGSDDEASRGELLVRGACDRIGETEAIDPSRVDWRLERDRSTAIAIVDAFEDYDLLIVGESQPSLTDRILVM
ncbi:hypothetical protein ACT4MF_12750 [Halorubrum sp. FL23]